MDIESIFNTPLSLPFLNIQYPFSKPEWGLPRMPSLPLRSRMLTASDAHSAYREELKEYPTLP